MRQNQQLLTEDIPSLIKKLALPASTGMFFNTMYNVIDTFYAGLISTQAIAALSLSFMLFFLIIGMGYGFSSAITSLIGNAFGRKRDHLATLYAHKGIVFVPIVGIVIAAVGFLLAPFIFTLMGATGEYLQDALDYIYTILFGVIFFMANFSLNAILVATGNTKTYRNTLIFGFFANIALNPLFIYGFLFIPAMGIKGIALATVFIQLLNMLYLLKKVLDTKLIHFERLDYFLPHKKIYTNIFNQGFPPSLNMLTMAIGSILLIYFTSHYGVKAVAGFGIGFRVEQLMLLPALGLSTAVLSLVSNNFGAKKYDRVKEILYTALRYGFAICAFGIAFLYIFGEFIIKQFDNDVEVVHFGIEYLFVEVWIFFAFLTLFICVSTLQGIKKPTMIFYVGLYRQIIAKIIVGYLIVKYFQLDIFWLWIGILVMIYSAAIFMFFYTRYTLKKLRIHI
ncbi:MAG: MATE family efflux transporter [Candidatus Marinarcus sp.]|uniref:MATE family efflux transporter n=1 Tax=Candidatus Marinarcus sp. TaxID=3100987 RepID=UPI003B002D3A